MSVKQINKLGHLEMCGHDLLAIAHKVESPFYLYFAKDIEEKYRLLKSLLPENMGIFYAVKANPNPEILALLKGFNSGFDISSGGEFSRCLSVGISPQNISFSGPGKNEKELSEVIRNNVFAISVESQREIEKIMDIVKSTSTIVNIMLRINPTKKPQKFSLKMGGLPSQFGVDEEMAPEIIKTIGKHDLLNFIGIHVFNGTQCLDSKAIINNISETIKMAERISQKESIELKFINLGGGFGVPYYEGDEELNIQEVCNAIKDILSLIQKTSHSLKNTRFILELGRFLVAQCGIYIAKITDIKVSKGKKFIILNGGMNHHLAASGNFGQVLRKNYVMCPLEMRNIKKQEKVNVVGPLCTPIDRLATEILLPELRIGDYIGIFNSGAYGFTASPLLFLSHNLPIEVFQLENKIKVVTASKNIQFKTYTI
ncbi:MAG: type III PLP-dependent enzyme [Candidatus Scalinduaceae bacterium]